MSEWNIESFYSKSWAIVKKQPVIWLFGLATVVLSGGSVNTWMRLFQPQPQATPLQKHGQKASFLNTLEEIENPKVTPKVTPPLYGKNGKQQAEFGLFADEFNKIGNQLKNVPLPVYVVLAIELFTGIVLSFLLAITAISWAQIALLKCFELLSEHKPLTPENVTTQSAKYLLPSLKYGLVTLLYSFGLFAGLIGAAIVLSSLVTFVGVMHVFSSVAIGMLIFLCVTVFVCGALYYSFKLNLSLIWGYYYLVLENTGAKKAFELGWKHSKGNLRKSIWLIFTNAFVFFIFTMIGFLPALILFAAPGTMVITKGFAPWMIPFFILGYVVGYPIAMFTQVLLRGVIQGTWFFAFRATQIHEKSSKTV